METIRFFNIAGREVGSLVINTTKENFCDFLNAHRNEYVKRCKKLEVESGLCFTADMDKFCKQMAKKVMPHFHGYVATYNTVVYILNKYADFDYNVNKK